MLEDVSNVMFCLMHCTSCEAQVKEKAFRFPGSDLPTFFPPSPFTVPFQRTGNPDAQLTVSEIQSAIEKANAQTLEAIECK